MNANFVTRVFLCPVNKKNKQNLKGERENRTLSPPPSPLMDCLDRLSTFRVVCVCAAACKCVSAQTVWTVSILGVIAAEFMGAGFCLISLTSRQAIWGTEMCYRRATLMVCSDTSLHAHCISETSSSHDYNHSNNKRSTQSAVRVKSIFTGFA